MGGNPSKPDPSRAFEVIGAGQSRTGTLSMQLALEKLFHGPVIHGGTHNISSNDDYLKKWIQACEARRAGQKERTLKLLREVTAGYVGCTDACGFFFVPELLELYPDAKVVLVTRNAERWWESFGGILGDIDSWFVTLLALPAPGIRWFPSIIKEFKLTADEFCVQTGRKPGEYGPWILEAHNDWVKRHVPKEKLLVMELGQGWAPLCDFLGKPIPQDAFPRVNDGEAANKTVKIIFAKLAFRWLGLLGVAWGCIFTAWKLCHV